MKIVGFQKGYTPWNKVVSEPKECVECGEKFTRKPNINCNTFATQRHCSYGCSSSAKSRNAKRLYKMMVKECGQCGVKFSRGPRYSNAQWKTRVFCSNECAFRNKDMGYTSLKNRMYHNSKYINWRKQVFQRDNYTCQFCNQVGGNLNADHIIPVKILLAKGDIVSITDINNGRTLCFECHKTTPSYGWKGARLCV